jgi:hypothetical protein
VRELIPRWWNKTIKDAKIATFKARVETVETKPFFRDTFGRTRCLIPVSGYYEWQDTPGGKQPWYFTARDGSPALTAAGLWDEWKDRQSGDRLKFLHDDHYRAERICCRGPRSHPSAAAEKDFDAWLTGGAGSNSSSPPPMICCKDGR